MHDELRYSQYLNKRSWLGGAYRRFILYPKLSRYLGGRVLDYGCGIGDFLRYRPGTVGVDINEYNVNQCAAAGLNALRIYRGGPLPFEKNSFDAAVMDNVLEHIAETDVAEVLSEIVRVLKPGAVLIVGVPGIKGYMSDPDHKTMYTEHRLKALLGQYGFAITKDFYTPINSNLLDRFVGAHCLYAVFHSRRIANG